MLRKSAAVLAVVLCLANANTTRAEPGPVVRLLMNEPASVFDMGMLRATLELNELKTSQALKDKPGYLVAVADYDLDTNRAVAAARQANNSDRPSGLISSASDCPSH